VQNILVVVVVVEVSFKARCWAYSLPFDGTTFHTVQCTHALSRWKNDEPLGLMQLITEIQLKSLNVIILGPDHE
jgi:hypothetical protein